MGGQEASEQAETDGLIVLSGGSWAVPLILGIPAFSEKDVIAAYFVELLLLGVPIPIMVACIVWFVRFINSQQKGERVALKWREMDHAQKALAVLIIVWICLNLYLGIGNELALLNIAVLPLSWIYSLAGSVVSWSSAATIVSLVILFQLRFPRRRIVP